MSMILKNIRWLCLGLFGWSFMAHAYDDKVCYPTSGSPNLVHYSVSKTISSAQNKADSLLDNEYISTGQLSDFTCNCNNPDETMLHWWSSQPTVPIDTLHSKLLLTPSIGVTLYIYIQGSPGGGDLAPNYNAVPFTGVPNNVTEPCGMSGSTTSGPKGKIAISITKPIISGADFDGPVAKIWHYRKPNYLNPSDPVESIIILNLHLTVPDNCTLLPGSTMNVDLGTLKPHQFRNKAYSDVPYSYTPKDFNLKFNCSISNTTLNVSLVGNGDTQGKGFATSKSDVSVIIKDKDGNIIPPDTLAGTVTVDGSKNSSTLTLSAYPTTNGIIPSVGEFSTTATILMSYQ